jgi:hypothetical protein
MDCPPQEREDTHDLLVPLLLPFLPAFPPLKWVESLCTAPFQARKERERWVAFLPFAEREKFAEKMGGENPQTETDPEPPQKGTAFQKDKERADKEKDPCNRGGDKKRDPLQVQRSERRMVSRGEPQGFTIGLGSCGGEVGGKKKDLLPLTDPSKAQADHSFKIHGGTLKGSDLLFQGGVLFLEKGDLSRKLLLCLGELLKIL